MGFGRRPPVRPCPDDRRRRALLPAIRESAVPRQIAVRPSVPSRLEAAPPATSTIVHFETPNAVVNSLILSVVNKPHRRLRLLDPIFHTPRRNGLSRAGSALRAPLAPTPPRPVPSRSGSGESEGSESSVSGAQRQIPPLSTRASLGRRRRKAATRRCPSQTVARSRQLQP